MAHGNIRENDNASHETVCQQCGHNGHIDAHGFGLWCRGRKAGQPDPARDHPGWGKSVIRHSARNLSAEERPDDFQSAEQRYCKYGRHAGIEFQQSSAKHSDDWNVYHARTPSIGTFTTLPQLCPCRQLPPDGYGRDQREFPGPRNRLRRLFHQPGRYAGTHFNNQIEDPYPYPGTNNYYTQDSYSGGSYVNCPDRVQPGRRVDRCASCHAPHPQ
jgi:hypothetical protein